MSEITTEQLGELIAQGKTGRVTRELLQVFLQNPQSVNGQPSKYTVSVDYGKSVKEMVAAGRYDWSNDDINDTNFKVNGNGVVTIDLELVHLNKTASSEDVLSYFEQNGLRPATLAELLAFGATYPEIQREFPIVCVDKETSSWVGPGGYRNVPYLSRCVSGRGLGLCWFGGGWGGVCRFLAVRKSA
ncbi:MAG: hypothetical protein WA057_01435 [Candidatus Magasanikiibacteriota bacterium]